MEIIEPGSTIGILGGGQLARMLTIAAAPLGYKCHIYCPEERSPAFQVADAYTIAAYDDEDALAKFASEVAVVTYEFENVPAATAEFIAKLKPLRPAALPLAISQDRLTEKTFLEEHGIATAPFAPFQTEAELKAAVKKVGLPAIAKTRRGGYDGKGQSILHSQMDIADAFAEMKGVPAILEGFIDFDIEVSAIVARGADNRIAAYPIAENKHTNHVLDETTVPANISEKLAATAHVMAAKLANALDYVGILALELFVVEKTNEVLVNEIAPRVHNSGHWSIEGARTSQFEQHIRAVCGLPLGDAQNLGNVRMKNLFGDDIHKIEEWLSDPRAHYHHYGKHEARKGRKMGHVTWVDSRE